MRTGNTKEHGPLAGTRIIELAGMGVAPYAATVLGDLGADVIRVDRVSGDPFEAPENRFEGRPMDFLIRRSRRSIALDLKSPKGSGLILKLIEHADGLLEGFRPGVAERLGIGPDMCLARNPGLVYVRASGWGQDGPYAHAPGHDLNYVALSGVLAALGRRAGPPSPPLNLIGDFAGGALFAVVGLLSALLHSRHTGKGQIVDASMIDGVAHLSTLYHGMLAVGAWTEEREANLLDGGSPLYDVYETAEGKYMSVAAGEPEFVSALFDELGVADQLARVDVRDRRNWPKIRETLGAVFRTKTRDEWAEHLAGKPTQCCAPVLSFTEAPTNEHNQARRVYVERHGVTQPAPAPRFSRTPAQLQLEPPEPGDHSIEILEEIGLSPQEIDSLLSERSVHQAEK